MKTSMILVTLVLASVFAATGHNYGVTLSVASSFQHDDLFKPNKIIEDGGLIYLFDSADQVMKVFTKEGKLMMRFGKKGEGPAEFINATDFCIADEKVFIKGKRKIAVFSQKNGNYLYERRLVTPSSLKFCKNGKEYYIFSLAYQKGANLITVCRDNGEPNLQLSHSFLECIPIKQDNFITMYKNFGCLAYFKERIYFAYMLSNTILEISPKGKETNRWTVPIPSIDVDKLKIIQKNSQMLLDLDRMVNADIRVKERNLYLLSNNEKGEAVIFKFEKNGFKETFRMKENIFSFDVSGYEIWAIGFIEEDIEILVYKIPQPINTR
jgi:hypothetical protein